MALGAARDVQRGGDDGERDDPDGQVDVEHPTPAQMLGEQSAQQRPEHTGGAEDGPEQPLVAPAFTRGDEVPHDGHGQHHESAAAQPLKRPEPDELRHVLGHAAQRRPDEEDDDGGLEEPFAPVLVAEFAPQRGGRGGREQIRRDHPGQMIHAAQIADDGGQRGGHDGLVEGGEQHPEQQGADRDEDIARHVLLDGGAVPRVGIPGHTDLPWPPEGLDAPSIVVGVAGYGLLSPVNRLVSGGASPTL